MITNKTKNAPRFQRRTIWLAILASVLAVPLAILWWPNWRQYPPATSPESMQTMKLLYAACNTKDTVRLKTVEERIEKLTRADKLSAAEQNAFAKILQMAHAGDWERAEKAAFRFAQDQVGVGHPAPKDQHHQHSTSHGKHEH